MKQESARRALIDPSKMRIARATCEAEGVTLHDQADCPKDRTCPVWDAFHPSR